VLPPIALVVVEELDWPNWTVVDAAALGLGEGEDEGEVED
jgi:hypothetical protein